MYFGHLNATPKVVLAWLWFFLLLMSYRYLPQVLFRSCLSGLSLDYGSVKNTIIELTVRN